MEIIKAAIRFLTHDSHANLGGLHRVNVDGKNLSRGQIVAKLGEFIDDRAQLEIEVQNYSARNEGLLTANANLRQQITSMNAMTRQMNEQFREAAERNTRIDMSATQYLKGLEYVERVLLEPLASEPAATAAYPVHAGLGDPFINPIGNWPLTIMSPRKFATLSVAALAPGRAHQLYTDADKDRPDAICDRNGQVVLAQCKVCGLAEIELVGNPECAGKKVQRGPDGEVLPEEPIPEGARRIACACSPNETCYQDKNGRVACDDAADRVDGNGRNIDTDMEADGDHDQGAQ